MLSEKNWMLGWWEKVVVNGVRCGGGYCGVLSGCLFLGVMLCWFVRDNVFYGEYWRCVCEGLCG